MSDIAAEPRELRAHIWARDDLDWYVEPHWTSARLFEVEQFDGIICDPACGSGRIVESANAADYLSFGYDVIDRGPGITTIKDFLSEDWSIPFHHFNVVTNPPFKHADKFARKALALPTLKVAMLLPATWHLGDARSRWLETTPLRRIWSLTPRPSMPPGAVLAAGEKPGGGTKDFAWFVWLRGYDGHPEARWLHRDGASDISDSGERGDERGRG